MSSGASGFFWISLVVVTDGKAALVLEAEAARELRLEAGKDLADLPSRSRQLAPASHPVGALALPQTRDVMRRVRRSIGNTAAGVADAAP